VAPQLCSFDEKGAETIDSSKKVSMGFAKVLFGPPIMTVPHQKVETFFEFAITHITQGKRSELWPRDFPTK
jgi:hypothetical protein